MFSVQEIINNIQNYSYSKAYPINSVWPPFRRSAVMIILFIGKYGELRVLLTKRSRQLNNFSGHVSLPGGKSDHDDETDWDVARRECFEEIGFPYDTELQQQGLKFTQLTKLPCYLSRTFLSVKPTVGLLTNFDKNKEFESINKIKLLLNPGETSSIFSIPLLDLIDSNVKKEYLKKSIKHYKWGKIEWPIKHFYYPSQSPDEVPWLEEILDLSSDDEHHLFDDDLKDHKDKDIKDLWGLTAQILFDLANISMNQTNVNYIGNENLIYGLTEFGGQMLERKRTPWESGMIVNERGRAYDEVLPQHTFKKLVKEFRL